MATKYTRFDNRDMERNRRYHKIVNKEGKNSSIVLFIMQDINSAIKLKITSAYRVVY